MKNGTEITLIQSISSIPSEPYAARAAEHPVPMPGRQGEVAGAGSGIGRGPRAGIRQWRRRRPRARRRLGLAPGRPVHGDHGAVGVRQVDPHALPRRARPADRGQVAIDGVRLGDLDDAKLTELRRDKVGFIFQFFNLLPVLSAEENILLPLSLAGRDADRERFDRLVDAVGLRDRLDHRPSELSGGQQQRVAIARALVSAPAVVFADEPTGNLDSQSSEEVMALLRRAVDEFGQTIVMVTHDPVAAESADRTLVLVGRQDPERHRMTRIALRYLWARKLRTFLTSLSIVLGVMMVTGTYVFTDTIDSSFEQIFTESNENIDAVVTGTETVESQDGTAPPLDAKVLDEVRKTDGVALAEGAISDPQVAIIGSDGEPTGTSGRADVRVLDRRRPVRPARLRGPPAGSGRRDRDRRPDLRERGVRDRRHGRGRRQGGGERVHDRRDRIARRGRLLRRRQLRRCSPSPRRSGSPARRGSSTRSRSPPRRASRPDDLVRELGLALPKNVTVETGEENVESQRDDIGEVIGFLTTALLIFAGVALFVAAFLIFNTFSITVAQRTREFGMLRALGANRRQIISSVVLEALVLGLLASILGFALGVFFAGVLESAFKAIGSTCPRPAG